MGPPLSDSAHPTLRRTPQLRQEGIQQNWVLLYLEGMVMFNDNVTAILQRYSGAHTLDMLIDDLQSTFGVQGIAPEVHAFVKHALERSWLV